MSSPSPTAPSNRSAMLVAFLVVFIDLLGFGIVLPLLPLIGEGYLGSESKATQDGVIALLFSLFSLMQFLFSPVWGRVSDRVGRRPVFLVSLGGSVVFYGLFAVACAVPQDNKWLAIGLMILSRVGAGIAGASVSTAAAVIADCTTPDKRAKGMGLIGAAFGIGFTFGPLIAYAVLALFPSVGGDLDPAFAWVPGATAATLSLVALLLAFARFKETLRPHTGPLPGRAVFSLARTLEVLKMPAVGPLVLIYFLAIFAFANFEATLARFAKDVFQLRVGQVALVFAGVGLVLMVAQGGFYRRFAGRVSEAALLRVGLVLMVLGLGGLGAVAFYMNTLRELGQSGPFLWQFGLAAGVAVFGFAFVNPSVAAMVSKRADPTRQGEVQGVNQSAAAVGRILGPAVGSMVYSTHSSHGMPFAVAVGVLTVVAGLQPFVSKGAPPTPARPGQPDVPPPAA